MSASLSLVALLLLCSFSAFAQLRLYVADGALEREVSGLYDLGSAGPVDLVEIRLRARNVGTAAVLLDTVRIAGQGFSVSPPSLPFSIAPGNAADIRVRFTGTGTGSYSANLVVNTLSLLLRVTVVAAPVLVILGDDGVSRLDIPAGTSIYMGRVLKGQSAARPLWLENRGRDPLAIRSVAMTGVPFNYRGPSPFTLAAGASQRVDVEFAPASSVAYSGTLTIDGRAFPVTGVGYDPPLPRPSIRIDGNTASGQQPKLVVQLASIPETSATGTLRMEFRPLMASLPDDPGIRFTSTGGRNMSVQIRAGDAQAWFGNQREAVFQTGTTAGTLTWTLELSTHTETYTLQLLPSAPLLDTALAGRRTQDLDVTLNGFDNTRSITQALFTFYDTAGRPISPGTIRTDIRREFEQFFTGSTATGGVFTMRASFPVSGGSAVQVASVEVEIVNSAGGTRTQRISFP